MPHFYKLLNAYINIIFIFEALNGILIFLPLILFFLFVLFCLLLILAVGPPVELWRTGRHGNAVSLLGNVAGHACA